MRLFRAPHPNPPSLLTAAERAQLISNLYSLRQSQERLLKLCSSMKQADPPANVDGGGRLKRFPWVVWLMAPIRHCYRKLRPRLYQFNLRLLNLLLMKRLRKSLSNLP